MAEANDEDDEISRRRKRGLLKLFYGSGNRPGNKPVNIYDIDEAHFQHDAYLEKMFKEKSLHDLMDKEAEIVKRM